MNHTLQYKKPELDMTISKQIIEDQNVSVEKKHPVLLAAAGGTTVK